MKIGTHQKSTMFSLSDRLYRIDQVPDHFKELFIFSGYRSPKSSPQQCVFSIFLPTNETFNFWTHFLPAVYFWFETWRLWYDLGVEPYTFPMMAYMLCLCVFPLTSAVAHVFNCLSDTARHICFFFDYAALSLYSLGAAIAYRAYVFPESLLSSTLTSLFLPIAIFNTFASLILSCETRFMEDGPWKKLFRILAYAVPYFFDSIPVFYRIFTTSFTDLFSGAVAFHLRQFMFTGMAAFVYVTHLPERLYPGSFDIIGHSHQLFHICTVFGSSDQMKGLLLDSQERREVLEPLMADLLPEPTDGIIYVFSIFFTTSLILAYFIYKLYKFKRMGRPMSRCGSFLDAVQLQLIANGAVAKGVAANGDRWQGEKYQQKKD